MYICSKSKFYINAHTFWIGISVFKSTYSPLATPLLILRISHVHTGLVAEWIERSPCSRQVVGSSPGCAKPKAFQSALVVSATSPDGRLGKNPNICAQSKSIVLAICLMEIFVIASIVVQIFFVEIIVAASIVVVCFQASLGKWPQRANILCDRRCFV